MDRLNYATVVLIPKKDEVKEVGDFRFISVLNALVKVITKVLANRLREVLGDMIDDNQTSFFGRNILESIAAAQEVIQVNKRNKTPRFMLKLDFEKTYDS